MLVDIFAGDDCLYTFWVSLLRRNNFKNVMSTQCNIEFSTMNNIFDMNFLRLFSDKVEYIVARIVLKLWFLRLGLLLLVPPAVSSRTATSSSSTHPIEARYFYYIPVSILTNQAVEYFTML